MAKAKEDAHQGEDKSKPIALTSQRALVALLTADDNYKGKIDKLTGELREEIGNAVEKKHLHKQAYAMVKKLYRIKSNEELHDLWYTFMDYAEKIGIVKRVESVQGLPLQDDGDEEGDAEIEGSPRPGPALAPASTH